MDYKTFLHEVIMEMPTRAYDTQIYIDEIDEKTEEVQNYEIVNITNEGSNDSLHIFIKKIG